MAVVWALGAMPDSTDADAARGGAGDGATGDGATGVMSSALGAQHAGRRVNVFFAEPAPGASYSGRLLYYRGGEFFVQWLNENGGQLEGEPCQWLDLVEDVACRPRPPPCLSPASDDNN